jgi:hypothetical protein
VLNELFQPQNLENSKEEEIHINLHRIGLGRYYNYSLYAVFIRPANVRMPIICRCFSRLPAVL